MKSNSIFDKLMTLVLTLICLVLLAATVYRMYSTKEEVVLSAREENRRVNVNAESAYIGTFTDFSYFQGEVYSPDANVSLYANTSGKVKRILVERGEHVEEGDIIAYVDASKPGAEYAESPVRSTISGEVLSVDVTAGMDVSTTTSIATIMGEKELRVRTNIPERYLSTLSLGLTGYVNAEAYGEKEFPVEISYISPIVKESNRTVEVELTFTDDSSLIKEGMYVSISLMTEKVDDVLLIPSAALTTYAGERVVYVANGNVAERRNVDASSDNGSEAIVLSGIEAGDVVITSSNVMDGSEIAIV